MESILQFDLLMSKMEETLSPKCPSEDIFYGDKFTEDLLFNNDLMGIELLADLDQDEKNYLEELQQITDQIDLPLYDIVTGNSFSPNENDAGAASPIEILDFESICESDVTTACQSSDSEYLSSSQDDFLMESVPFMNDNQYNQDYHLNSSSQQPCNNLKEENNSSQQVFGFNLNDANTIEKSQIISFFNKPQDDFQLVDEIIETTMSSHSHSYENSEVDEKTSYAWSINSSPQSESSGPSYYSVDEEPVKKHSRLRGVTKKRSRHGRNPEEKRSRKKEQNKNAATRYRMKKKEEIHVIHDEERILLDRNRKLSNTYKDTKREVKYLKSLLRELYQARGFAMVNFQNL